MAVVGHRVFGFIPEEKLMKLCVKFRTVSRFRAKGKIMKECVLQ